MKIKIICVLLLFCLAFPLFSENPLIIIDPGHGGPDPGDMREIELNGEKVFLLEKDINLQIAYQLMEILQTHYECRLTRYDDRYLTLEQRFAQIKEDSAKLSISLHQIFSGRVTLTKGIYIKYNNNENSKLLAEAVAEGLSNTIGKIPGGVDLIQYMFIPQQTAITVECKLISHGRYEPKMLLDVEFLRLISAGIAWGVDKYTVLPRDKIEP